MIYGFFEGLGAYFNFLTEVFRRPEHWREYYRSFLREVDLLGFSSIALVCFISLFMGAVVLNHEPCMGRENADLSGCAGHAWRECRFKRLCGQAWAERMQI